MLAGPFPPWRRCGFLPYIQYGCETTPCPDVKFLADHSCQRAADSPNRGVQRQRPRSPAAAGEIPAGRSQRNTRAAHGAKSPIVPKRHPQMAQSPRRMPQGRRPHPIAGGGRRSFGCPPTVGRGILDAPILHYHPGPSGMPAPTFKVSRNAHRRRDTQVPPYVPYRQSVRVRRARHPGGGGKPPPYTVEHFGPAVEFRCVPPGD